MAREETTPGKGYKVIATSKEAARITELLNEMGITEGIVKSGVAAGGEIESTEKETKVTITNRFPKQ